MCRRVDTASISPHALTRLPSTSPALLGRANFFLRKRAPTCPPTPECSCLRRGWHPLWMTLPCVVLLALDSPPSALKVLQTHGNSFSQYILFHRPFYFYSPFHRKPEKHSAHSSPLAYPSLSTAPPPTHDSSSCSTTATLARISTNTLLVAEYNGCVGVPIASSLWCLLVFAVPPP